ncbi:hypothetical protein [Algoriphagus hitonicola]|uniref:Uncharacterized protein n=1 Tax=Algoriphagus hitonicola TaxID=435880 RepID=A0A1I2SZP2_9BACT|nr:hypothetical protein [Algoriphagus hitonicola]SFG56447.1 hypothetical protein SAMN04487988_10575 [Algoriphagus hitonicola]
MEKLTNDQMENLVGGTDRFEYCTTLATMWTSGGWQGGFNLFMETWGPNCAAYGYDFDPAPASVEG